MSYIDYMKAYGLKPMSLKEEMDLPSSVKQTRENKIKLVDTITRMERMLACLKTVSIAAPEINDYEHALIMYRFYSAIKEAEKAIDKANNIRWGH